MNIYFLSYSYEKGVAPDIGGFRKLWEVADRLQKQGHQVRVFFPQLPYYKPLKEISYTLYPLINLAGLRGPSAYLSMFFSAFAIGSKEKPNVIYFRTSLNILPVILARLLGAKAVLEVNASFREFYRTIKVSPFKYLLHLLSEKFNARFSDKIISLTPGLKKILITSYGLSPNKIYVVPSGTDTEHFLPLDMNDCKKKIGIDPTHPVIGFAGIFYPHQGVNNLIYASKFILKNYPQANFLIIGSGIMNKTWQELSQSEGVDKSFVFAGQIPYKDMPIYFNAMDVFVAPFTSNRGETSPLKVLDALACARPVIASAIPSILPLSQEFNGSVINVPANNPEALATAVIELISDSHKREEVGRKGRANILQKYSWESVAQEISGQLQ